MINRILAAGVLSCPCDLPDALTGHIHTYPGIIGDAAAVPDGPAIEAFTSIIVVLF